METPRCNHSNQRNHCNRTNHWRWTLALASIGLLPAASPPASAQPLAVDDARWQVSVGADSASALTDTFFDTYQAHGFELGLAYRVSPRFGLGVVSIQHQIREEFEFDFFGAGFSSEFRYEPTWLLARADFHLTPGRRVDFVISPMAGMVRTSDVELRTDIRLPFPEPDESATVRFSSRDGFAWGLRLGLDIPLGRIPGRSSLTTGLTFLGAEEDTDFGTEPGEEIGIQYELLSFHVGYAYRF